MSLQVWLPLTKDLRNQGLSNVTVTNNGATFNSAGKLGGCYTFTNQTIVVTPSTALKNSFGSAASLACWVKVSASHAAYAQCMTFGTVSGSWTAIYFGIDMNGSGVPIGNVANGSGYTNCSFGTAIKDGQWHHLALTYESGTIKSYMDGVLKNTVSTSYTPAWTNATVFSIGGNSSEVFKNGDAMNDVRLYNHCLSPMEVKELSKGLVLHYPLNRQGWGQENILLNTGFQSRYTQSTGWDTTKNGTQLANNWGGYNSGVNNQATVYHAHLKEFNGEWVYEYIKTANESWLGISQSGLQSKITAGKQYTFSWEQYLVSGSNYNRGGLYYYKTGASSAGFHLGSFSGVGGTTGKWEKFSYTFTAPSDADYSKSMSWYIYGMYGGNGTLYMRHPKLEEDSKVTPWCPNSSDTLATTVGLNSTTEYDCSGFCNNGIKNNSPTYSSDTAKYNVSTHLDGVNQTIQLPNLLTLIPDSIFTFNIWFKRLQSEPSSKPWETLFGGPSGFEIETCSANNVHDNKIRAYSWGGGTIEFEFDKWNMLTMVSNGTNALFYLNGELKLTGTYKALVNGNYFIGSWSNTATQNYKGYVCDARIYATALSADDVKSLYQNSAYIDNSGNVYGAVHMEV